MSKDIAFILYNTPDHSEKVQVVIKDDTLWMTQKAMGELFGCSSDNIGVHLKNIFTSNELDANSVTEKISATASDGKNYATDAADLEGILRIVQSIPSKKAEPMKRWLAQVGSDHRRECSHL